MHSAAHFLTIPDRERRSRGRGGWFDDLSAAFRSQNIDMYAMTSHRKLSEISQLGAKETMTFRKLPPDAKRAVLERILDDITADKLKAAVAEVKTNETRRSV